MDRERYLDQVGDAVEPGGRPPAPGSLRTVQRFINTFNHELGTERDRLSSPERAREWLGAEGLLDPGDMLDPAELGLLHDLRESLRALAAENRKGGRDRDERAALQELASRWPLHVDFEAAERPILTPGARGGAGVGGRLLAIVYESWLSGGWARIKACRQCNYIFFDRSKNRSSAWCAMSVCGNREKNRAYRRRARKSSASA